MTDDMLRAVAKNGGVVDVNFFSGFLDQNYWNALQAQRTEQAAATRAYLDKLEAEGKQITYVDDDRITREWMAKIPRPPFTVLIDHIDHIAKVAGIDHVGLGSDFDGVSGATPLGWIPRPTCPKSHKPCSIADTAPQTFIRSSAATFCACSKKWSASAGSCRRSHPASNSTATVVQFEVRIYHFDLAPKEPPCANA